MGIPEDESLPGEVMDIKRKWYSFDAREVHSTLIKKGGGKLNSDLFLLIEVLHTLILALAVVFSLFLHLYS